MSGSTAWAAAKAYAIDFDRWTDFGEIRGHDNSGASGKATEVVDKLRDFSADALATLGQTFIVDVGGTNGEGVPTRHGTTEFTGDTLTLDDGISAGTIDDEDAYRLTFELTTLADVEGNDNPPSGLLYFTHHANRFWGNTINSSTVHFSRMDADGAPQFDAWPQTAGAGVPRHRFFARRDDGDIMTGIHPAAGSGMVDLYAFKENRVVFIRGTGLVQGLYTPNVEVDLDAGGVNESAGCAAPGSIVTLSNTVLFIGYDKQIWSANGRDIKPVSQPVQPFLEDIPESRFSQLKGFVHRNCYHLAFPSGDNENDRVLVFNAQDKFWAVYEWGIRDAFFSTGGTDNGILYASLAETNHLDKLFNGTTDAGDDFKGKLQTNWRQLPTHTVVYGVQVIPADPTLEPSIGVRLDMDNREGTLEYGTVYEGNNFVKGVFGRGNMCRVYLEGEELDKIIRVAVMYN
jgi:hypothetical protein